MTIKIEAGKWYEDVGGDIWYCFGYNPITSKEYPYALASDKQNRVFGYDDFGKFIGKDRYRDIVKEIPDPREAEEDAESTDDGWIPWKGGECPVDRDMVVEVKLIDGRELQSLALAFSWSELTNKEDFIVAYRIVKEVAPVDNVNHPKHYTQHPSGVECIQITEHMGFCLGNAVKYIWRADLKGGGIEDLQKAKWYLEREIALREASNGKN